MPKARHCFIQLLAMFVIAVALGSVPARAGLPEVLLAFHQKLIAIGDAATNGNAAESIKQCQAFSDEIKNTEGVTPLEVSYVETQVEACIALVMHEGQYTDGTGDACSHYYAYAKMVASLAETLTAEPAASADFKSEVILQLEHAGDKSKLLDCTDDYTVFAPAIAAAKQAAAGTTDLSFMNEILAATAAITPENAKESVATCNGFGQKMVETQGLSDVENNYYPAIIEACLAVATEKGNFTDEYGGDACSHLYGYAESLHAAIEVARNRPGAFQDMVPDMQANLEKAVAHAAELTCPQDLSDVK
jgi:uncharacterized surface protein with fasciclin (FAS1) repeats